MIATLVSLVGIIIGITVFMKILGRKTQLLISAIFMAACNIGIAVTMIVKQVEGLFAFLVIIMFIYGAFSLAPGWTYPN